MTTSQRPRLRYLESFPVSSNNGESLFALRDPEGFARSIVIPHPAAILASLMDGDRTLAEIQQAFHQQTGSQVALSDLEALIADLDERLFLENERYRTQWKQVVEGYLNNKVRPAAHAGGAYASEPEPLARQLDALFLPPAGPGRPSEPHGSNGSGRLCGILSPHIDFHRGGPTFAWAYKRLVEESDADLFVVFGTAHNWMRYPFSVSKKHFETPLGIVETDQEFVRRLAVNMKRQPNGDQIDLFASELVHRNEHSLEFQMVFLEYLLGGKRPFKVVPILAGSFHDFVVSDQQPISSPAIAAFVKALQATVAEHSGKVCFISGGDLAHIGRRFGDRELLDQPRLKEQAASDHALLEAACRADATGFFDQVANVRDKNRICGLSPTYTMLEVLRPKRGELLKYDQAVEPDGSACVSFGSLAFYGD